MIFVIYSSKATKKEKNLEFYPTSIYRWGHLRKNQKFSKNEVDKKILNSGGCFFIYAKV
jgi:hypothetical protein